MATHAKSGTVTAAASFPPAIPPVSSSARTLSIDTPVCVPFPAETEAGVVPFQFAAKEGPRPVVVAHTG